MLGMGSWQISLLVYRCLQQFFYYWDRRLAWCFYSHYDIPTSSSESEDQQPQNLWHKTVYLRLKLEDTSDRIARSSLYHFYWLVIWPALHTSFAPLRYIVHTRCHIPDTWQWEDLSKQSLTSAPVRVEVLWAWCHWRRQNTEVFHEIAR